MSSLIFFGPLRSSCPSLSGGGGHFIPPPGKGNYLAARETLDPTNLNDLDKLKKLLMRRALENIPNLLSLQNEGSAIDRLYKRGMLTDDVMERIKEMKAFFEPEFAEVQQEADSLLEGWAQSIWPQAMSYHKLLESEAEKLRNAGDAAVAPAVKKVAAAQPVADAAAAAAPNKKVVVAPVIPVETEEQKAARLRTTAEKMAAALLAEEEKEKNKNKQGSGKKAGKK